MVTRKISSQTGTMVQHTIARTVNRAKRGRPTNAQVEQRRKKTTHDNAEVIPSDHLITTKDLCDFLQISKNIVTELIRQDGLPVHIVGGSYRYDRQEVWQWLQQRQRQSL